MAFTALSCPQCGGPLPRQALWRIVVCPHCGSTVTRSNELVQRASFRSALDRAASAGGTGRQGVWTAGAIRYACLARLGTGSVSDVFLAERLGAVGARVTLKIARDDGAAAGAKAVASELQTEATNLVALQASDVPGAAFFSRQLPQPVFAGVGEAAGGERHALLVLRHPEGFWGSLEAVLRAQPNGVDARHVVWMWRRALQTLAFVHAAGWTHGDLLPQHLLVHPADHGIRIIGWARARRSGAAALAQARERDIAQLAWSMRLLLGGQAAETGTDAPAIPTTTPAPLADLLRSASEDARWRGRHGCDDIERALIVAAAASFGPARFVPFDPLGGSGAAGA